MHNDCVAIIFVYYIDSCSHATCDTPTNSQSMLNELLTVDSDSTAFLEECTPLHTINGRTSGPKNTLPGQVRARLSITSVLGFIHKHFTFMLEFSFCYKLEAIDNLIIFCSRKRSFHYLSKLLKLFNPIS